mgnify:CR=1 FL=1
MAGCSCATLINLATYAKSIRTLRMKRGVGGKRPDESQEAVITKAVQTALPPVDGNHGGGAVGIQPVFAAPDP